MLTSTGTPTEKRPGENAPSADLDGGGRTADPAAPPFICHGLTVRGLTFLSMRGRGDEH